MLSETYEIYVRILNFVDNRVSASLGWNTPDWRVNNACKACCYVVRGHSLNSIGLIHILTSIQLKDEPDMAYSRLWAHDGNNSLKRVLPFGNRTAADIRVFEHSSYFLPRSFVDRFANEVKSSDPNRHREVRSADQDSGDEDDSELDDADQGGDPTDGVHDTAANSVDHCVKNWKAAAADEKKRTWAIFDETGIYASACRHGLILWICDMVRSGEL